jgi:hypothetical protein
MARATRLPEMLSAVAFDLVCRDDVGLADQARPESASLDLMAKRRGRKPELAGSLGEGQHRSVLGGRQVLRGLVGDPSSRELGAGGPKSSGRLDPVPERIAREKAVQADRRDPDAPLGRFESLGCVEQRLEVRHLDGLCVRVHGPNMARIGHECKARRSHSRVVSAWPRCRREDEGRRPS